MSAGRIIYQKDISARLIDLPLQYFFWQIYKFPDYFSAKIPFSLIFSRLGRMECWLFCGYFLKSCTIRHNRLDNFCNSCMRLRVCVCVCERMCVFVSVLCNKKCSENSKIDQHTHTHTHNWILLTANIHYCVNLLYIVLRYWNVASNLLERVLLVDQF